jgi:HEAT repeat protein
LTHNLVLEFQSAAADHGAGKVGGNADATNEAFDRMIAVVKELRKHDDKGRAILMSCLQSDDPAVRSAAATYLLPLDEPRAVAVLEDVARVREPLIGFSAEMVLREWKAGRLVLP